MDFIWQCGKEIGIFRIVTTAMAYTGEVMGIIIDDMLSLKYKNGGQGSWINSNVCD